MWEWMSTNPGMMVFPVTSMTVAPESLATPARADVDDPVVMHHDVAILDDFDRLSW